MRALRFFASLSLVFVPALTGCSLVLDTDPPDPGVPPDLGVVDFDSGERDLGPPDLARPDADSSDGHVGLPDGDAVDAGCTFATDCVAPDACTVVACVGGTCSFSALDCAAVLPALIATDCRGPACEPSFGCLYAPVHSRCDDGVGCTYDYCRDVGGTGTPGTCGHEPQHLLCDDLLACTLDTCAPLAPCTDPGGVSSGCRHTPDDAACRTLAADLMMIHPGLACASPVCIGPTAGNPAGCGFEGGCASGQTCGLSGGTGTYSCLSSTGGITCGTDAVCNDGNPCNGTEACTAGHCAATLISPCHLSPTGPTLDGTCAFTPDSVICAPPSELCAVVGGP